MNSSENDRLSRSVSIQKQERPYSGFFKIDAYTLTHELSDGRHSEVMRREVFSRGHSAAVLPWDPNTDSLLLIRQFLIGAHVAGLEVNAPWQVVAGMVEPGEAPEGVARREAIEESGCQLDALIKAQDFLPSPGGSSELISTFLAVTDLSHAGGHYGLAEEGEDIVAKVMPVAEVMQMLDRGEILSGPAVVLLSWFGRKYPDLIAEYGPRAESTPEP